MILEIFKTGTHTDSKGRTKTYSEADLDRIVNSYKPNEREVPLVLGHPKDNDPAFGWVEKLFRKGKSLFAKTKDEDPAFVNAVKNRKFPKRSISLTEDLRLNHIGFLGAALPAVDGLAPVQFSDNADYAVIEFDDILTVDFENPSNNDLVPREIESGDSNIQKTHAISAHEQGNMQSQYMSPGSLSHSEDNAYANALSDISSTLDEVKSLTENFARNFKLSNAPELSDKERNHIRERLDVLNMKLNINNFEVLLNEKLLYGSLTPVMKDKITKTLQFISSQNFSEFNSEKFVLDLKSQLLDFINSIPKIVEFSDVADKPDDEPDDNLVDSDYGGLPIDEVSNSFHKKVLLKMKEEDIDYSAALQIVAAKS